MVYTEYTWIFGVACVAGLACAMGIGANDFANAWASCVGSRALTMRQAIVIGAVCEFTGATLLGASVSATIKSNIIRLSDFKDSPDLLMWGFLVVLIAAAFWDNYATYLELPVSTTHTTVAATVGMGLGIFGPSDIIWSSSTSTFPYITGIVPIVASWFVSPLLSGTITAALYALLRTFVLRSPHSFARTFFVLPLLIFLNFFVVIFFIIQTGNRNYTWVAVPDRRSFAIAGGASAGLAAIAALLILPRLRRKILSEDADLRRNSGSLRQLEEGIASEDADGEATTATPGSETPLANGNSPVISLPATPKHATRSSFDTSPPAKPERQRRVSFHQAGSLKSEPSSPSSAADRQSIPDGDQQQSRQRLMKQLTHSFPLKWHRIQRSKVFRVLTYCSKYDVHQVGLRSPAVKAIWENAEVFDWKVERVFRYMQVFSAMVMSLAHGSTDVSNAVAPFSAIYYTWRFSVVPSSITPVPIWILAYGGAGIVLGVALFSYPILTVLGVKLVKLSNVRGFCAELSTAITVILAARYGLPVSTTQVICGAILAIGLFEGTQGINWRLACKIVCGWLLTLVVAGTVGYVISGVGCIIPNKTASITALQLSSQLDAQTLAMIQQMNQTNGQLGPNFADPGLMSLLMAWNNTLSALTASGTANVTGAAALQQTTFGAFNNTLAYNPWAASPLIGSTGLTGAMAAAPVIPMYNNLTAAAGVALAAGFAN